MLTTPKKIIFLCLLLLSAVSLFWFTSHIFEKFPWGEQYPQRDPDSVLFARLLEQSILKGEILEVDNFGAYPYEIAHGFPPFYLSFLVHVTGFFYTLFPGCGFDPMYVAGALPVIFTWLTGIILLFSLWRISSDSRLVLFSAFCMLPGFASMMVGTFMKLDYDFLISFYIWSWICLTALHFHQPSDWKKIAGGLVAALFLATWSAAPFFFFFVTVYGFVLWLAKAEEAPGYLEFSYSGMLIGGILNIMFLFAGKHTGPMFSITKYSLFQPLCLIIGGVFFMSLKFFSRSARSRTLGIWLLILASLTISLAFSDLLMQSTGILLQKDPVHKTISELASIVTFDQLATSGKETSTIVSYFSWPIIFLSLFVFLKPVGLDTACGRLLKFWLALMIFLSVYQIRYVRWLTVGGGLYAGMVVTYLWNVLASHFRCQRWKNLRLSLAFFPLLLLFSMQSYSHAIYDLNISSSQVEVYNWISQNTPPVSGYSDDKRPEYSILSYWDEGNLLAYYARRPVAVNNAMWGYKTMADIFSARNEDEAFELCEKKGVRYLLLSTFREFSDESCSFWPSFKTLPERPEYVLQYGQVELLPRKEFEKWFYFWLNDNLALTPRGDFGNGTRFRVVYASKADEKALSPYFLFERVAGARLSFAADPGSEAVISLQLKIAGKDFLYKTRKIADSEGKVAFILPYSTGHHGGRVQTEPFYKLAITENQKMVKAAVTVSNAEILEGRAVADFTRLQVEDVGTPASVPISEPAENP